MIKEKILKGKYVSMKIMDKIVSFVDILEREKTVTGNEEIINLSEFNYE